MDYENISPELKEKALACKSTEELVALAKSEGIELSEEQLESIAGGSWYDGDRCDDYTCQVVCSAGVSRDYAEAGVGDRSMM